MWQTIRISLRSYRRNFRKHWIYNLLNIGGLSIAFICLCLMIAYIFHETSYDRFNSKADRIFRPTYQMQSDNGFAVHWARIPDDYINELPNDIPEIAKLIRFQNQEQKYIRVGEERFKPRHAYTTDAEVFEVFDFKIVDGAVSDGLLQPYSVVLTETLARRYFGKTDVIGKQIYVTGDWTPEEQPYTVTAVMADLPANTHLPVELLFSFKNAEERSGWAYVYTLLQENASIEQVQAKMGAFVSKYQDPDATMKVDIVFQPLTGIHLTSNLAREIKPNSSLFYVRIFWGVGLFIWLIALVNFSNLSSALALTKGKEAGVRKILGAQRRHLVMSALGDSIIGSLMALLIAILIAWWCLPGFEMLTGTSLLPQFSRVLPILLSVSVVSGIIAGLVPAFMMYGIDILRVLKESNQWSWKQKGYTANVKKTMVMLQFTATIVLLSGALIARQQFAFIQEKNLGMNAEQVVAIAQVPDAVKLKYPLFKDRVSKLSGVTAVAACMEVPSPRNPR
ncbi:MAG: hypothetical protein HKN76_13340 [Saprospiraceae bacterium]|nr:hypothetical protein [Saprospiraceae bacterium]